MYSYDKYCNFCGYEFSSHMEEIHKDGYVFCVNCWLNLKERREEWKTLSSFEYDLSMGLLDEDDDFDDEEEYI